MCARSIDAAAEDPVVTPEARTALVEKVEAFKDYAEDLRSVTWLSPVSAQEMNTRDRWLADEFDKMADAILEALPVSSGGPEPLAVWLCYDCDKWFLLARETCECGSPVVPSLITPAEPERTE